MSLKSGWCMDEVQALDIERPDLAVLRHGKCRSSGCTCPNHGVAHRARQTVGSAISTEGVEP